MPSASYPNFAGKHAGDAAGLVELYQAALTALTEPPRGELTEPPRGE